MDETTFINLMSRVDGWYYIITFRQHCMAIDKNVVLLKIFISQTGSAFSISTISGIGKGRSSIGGEKLSIENDHQGA